jgi:hypothetical protein
MFTFLLTIGFWFFCSTGDKTKHLMHASQVFYCWATSSAQFFSVHFHGTTLSWLYCSCIFFLFPFVSLSPSACPLNLMYLGFWIVSLLLLYIVSLGSQTFFSPSGVENQTQILAVPLSYFFSSHTLYSRLALSVLFYILFLWYLHLWVP